MSQPCFEFKQHWDEHWHATYSAWCSCCGFTIDRVAMDLTDAPGITYNGRRLGFYRGFLDVHPVICCNVCKAGKRELSPRLS